MLACAMSDRPASKPPLFFVATYSRLPMWAACVRPGDSVRYAQLDPGASVDDLRKIEFGLQHLGPQGQLADSLCAAWRSATAQERPRILMTIGHRLLCPHADLGWAKSEYGAQSGILKAF